jgi:hypothetical protein
MSKKRRTEDLSVTFINRQVAGWAFAVGDCFRTQLDLRFEKRMDIEANTEKKNRLGRPLDPSEKASRFAWTQGVPPAYSFDRGHVFHEIEESHEGIRRSIIVLRAKPDPGALVEKAAVDESGDEITKVTESETDEDASNVGFVDYEVISYKAGKLITTSEGIAFKAHSSSTQAGFVELLRTGK